MPLVAGSHIADEMIKQSVFTKAVKEFDKREMRADFFALASNLITNGFGIEAYTLLLATCNLARFRYAITRFDIQEFRKTLRHLRKHFDALKNQAIESVDLDKYKSDISAIFNELSKIKGIEFTGAPKLMHLTNPKLFVMWDDYIRGTKSKKYYQKLPIVQSGVWKHEKYPKDAEGYIRFLKDMKYRFSHLRPPSVTKTLAKAIDEFNYVRITLPVREMEKKAKQHIRRKR